MNKERKNIYLSMEFFKTALFVLIDALIIAVCYMLGILSCFKQITASGLIFILGVIFVKIIIFVVCQMYKTITSNFGVFDAVRFTLIIFLSDVTVAFVDNLVLPGSYLHLDLVTYIFITALEAVLIVASRSFKRVVRLSTTSSNSDKRTMIIGAGAAGKIAFDEIHNNPTLKNKVVCFFDEDLTKVGKRYLGKKVYGPSEKITEVIKTLNIEEVIIAISNLSKKELKDLIALVSKENVVVKRLPLLTEMDVNKSFQIKEVSLAELLGRDQITFDTTDIKNFIKGRRVLVTGAGGSIGSELVNQIYSFHPSEIVLFDIYENNVYDVQQNLVRKIKKEQSDIKLYTIIGSTYNETRVKEIFERYLPEIVFHAAAYKHVPLMEDSPVEAIRTNVIGTYNVAKYAALTGCIKMTLVSTDKAVRPTNTMGATKSFAEMIIRYFDSISPNTSYSAVRFGNVLGSNGSVIPLFKKQIAEGGPVTVTHKDIIRFFMTIPEAVSLILQSATYAKGGEIFILDMGEPVKIVTLAENVIKQCGYIPYKDIDIVFTGLRPGEKLFEELLLNVTEHEKTDNNLIYIEKRKKVQPIEEEIEYIRGALNKTDNDEIKDMLRHVVTSYTNYEEFNKEHSKVAK